ncbi:MAG: DMT family transporter [Opitutaceae bacterium]|jgi:drug/metabolite transporter (DMT)-like permease
MHWIVATFASALFLGFYELFTKHAVQDNAVLPVLFFSNVCSTVIWSVLMGAHAVYPEDFPALFVVASLTPGQHGLLAFKSALVAASWTCTYFAVKHLPVSITSPIRATGPLWTLVGALALLAERPTGLEMLGVATTLASFVGLSFAGRQEGIHFYRNKWIGWLVAGTILNGISALYDKFLLGRAGFSAATVQAWFSIYLALFFLPLAVGWKRRWWPRQEFHWRWSIPLISCALLVADFIYFGALSNPHALISLVASLRRSSMLVAFTGGLLFFGEKNGRQKLPAVLGVLAGIGLTVLG